MNASARFDSFRFATVLEEWFAAHGKTYPWRQTRDPYAILVSEIMLQQTQIATVLERGYFSRWLARFPDFATLAAASEEDVLKGWEGLGYYRRARNLQKLARAVIDRHDGVFPAHPDAILALPGIGPYTAGALASFAFGLAEPLVDGNVARVLSRVFNDSTPVDSRAGSQVLWQRARELVQSASDARVFNSALMELGQTLCRVGKPNCDLCPVSSLCRAEAPSSLPVKQARTTLTDLTERVFFQRTAEGILLQQETGSRRTGMWKLPELPEVDVVLPPVLLKSRYGITRYRVTLWVHAAPDAAPVLAHTRRFGVDELDRVTMPSPYRRALHDVLKLQSPFILE
jgi:A/G-specific adenine glycosylase